MTGPPGLSAHSSPQGSTEVWPPFISPFKRPKFPPTSVPSLTHVCLAADCSDFLSHVKGLTPFHLTDASLNATPWVFPDPRPIHRNRVSLFGLFLWKWLLPLFSVYFLFQRVNSLSALLSIVPPLFSGWFTAGAHKCAPNE